MGVTVSHPGTTTPPHKVKGKEKLWKETWGEVVGETPPQPHSNTSLILSSRGNGNQRMMQPHTSADSLISPEDQVQTFPSCDKLGVPRPAQCLQEPGREPHLLETAPKGQATLNLRKARNWIFPPLGCSILLNQRASWGVALEGSIGSTISHTSETTLQPSCLSSHRKGCKPHLMPSWLQW